MKPEEITLIIQQARDAWITGDGDSFAELFIPDGEFIVPGKVWVGQAQIRQAVVDFATAYSDIKIEIKRIIIEGNCAVVEWYWEEIENTTKIRSMADDAIVIDFQSERISCWREYIDTKSPQKSKSTSKN